LGNRIMTWLVGVVLTVVGCASQTPAPPRPTPSEIRARQLQQIESYCRESVAAGGWGGDLNACHATVIDRLLKSEQDMADRQEAECRHVELLLALHPNDLALRGRRDAACAR
jgi:hypothetical protein